MSLAKLNILITEKGNPCRISKQTLYVHVLNCDGTVLEWCDRRYLHIPAKCGHLELEVPPGCYVVGAVENPSREAVQANPPLGNHLTHIGIVRVNCGDHACVTLFNPTLHHCGHWFLTAVRGNLNNVGAFPREAQNAARNAAQAVEALIRQIPQDTFTVQQAKTLDEKAPLVKGGAKKAGKGGAKKGGGGA